jgi:2-deoxy-D-gluconate 3-dehydrogenase
MKIAGKTAIVTGGASGLGEAAVIRLHAAGANVVIADLNEEKGNALAAQLGDKAIFCKCNVTVTEDVKATINAAVEKFGALNILVNNAGICPRQPILDYSVKNWQDTVQVNLNAPWFIAQSAARQMVKQGHGKIINIASLLSHQGGLLVPAYTASKHGILGFTKALSNDLAPKGVNVNSITPGYMHTDLTDPLVNDPEYHREKVDIEARIPMGRWGTIEDLQGAALLLASDAGAYIHGTNIAVDGGWLAW